jgi:hypothetical protein
MNLPVAISLKPHQSKFLLGGFLLASTWLCLLVLPVFAADTASVTATVTVQNISVSVSDGSVAYGTMALNSSAGTNGTDTQTATNDGNVTVDFNIRGYDTAAWTLAGSNGANQYVHQFCVSSCASAPTGYTALTTNYQTLAASKTASATQTFDLYITTPTSTSTYDQQSADVLVQAALP